MDQHRGNLEAAERLRDTQMEDESVILLLDRIDRYMPATQAMPFLTTVARTSNNRSHWTVTVLLCALSIGLSGCNAPVRSQNIGPKFTIRWTVGAKPQDSHVPRALYYGERQIAFDILEYDLSPDPEILLYYNNQKDSGLYVFNGHKGANTRVHDVLPNGIITSEGIGFPTQYSVHWSSDAAYVVVGDDYRKRWEVIDIFQAHVVAPGWIIAYDAGGETWFSSWESDRAFKVENYYPDSRHPSRHETLNVTLDPFQIRAEDGTIRWPRP